MIGLKRLVAEYRANTNGEVVLSGKPEELDNLPHAQALALFHICQEALANAAKHAKPRRVDVSVWVTDARVMMEVRDDGQGLDLAKESMRLGHGLSNMQTRAQQARGELEITSAAGQGTSVLVWVPRLVRESAG
jgi:signal transduction histidine kinase